jgi:hypothetical protein
LESALLVTIKELRFMLGELYRAAVTTRQRCEENQEDGYDTRRANDVAHAVGRIESVESLKNTLDSLADGADPLVSVDTSAFLNAFSADMERVKADFCNPKGADYFTNWGRYEVYTDVTGIIESWLHLADAGC